MVHTENPKYYNSTTVEQIQCKIPCKIYSEKADTGVLVTISRGWDVVRHTADTQPTSKPMS